MTSVEMGSCGSKLKQNQQGGEKKKKGNPRTNRPGQ